MTTELITKTGCNVFVSERHDERVVEGVYLNLSIDTRFAELKMTTTEARRIGWALIESAKDLDHAKLGLYE